MRDSSPDLHLAETLLSREVVHRGDFLTVHRDTVRLPDGGSATREYVVHPLSLIHI